MGSGLVTVRKSRLTGHWIVDRGGIRSCSSEGFRHWKDAMAEADRRTERYRRRSAAKLG